MRVNILHVLGVGAVYIPRDIQIIVIFYLYLLVGNKTGIPRVIGDPLVKRSNYLVNILLPQTVLVAVLDKVTARVDHKYALALIRVGFVNYDNTGGNTRTVEKIGRQAYNAFDISPVNDRPSDGCLRISPEQNTVR